jgi:sugar phosphate isomerase/epimerase
MLNRREFLARAGGAALGSMGAGGFLRAASGARKCGMGVVIYSYHLRAGADRSFIEPMHFLEYCHGIGAGGIQAAIGAKDKAYTDKLRSSAEDYGMFVEATASLPEDKADSERFEAEVVAAKDAGAEVVRVVTLPAGGSGRRYEDFDTCEGFRKAWRTGRDRLEVAARIAERQGMKLAVENHKDARIGEMIEMLGGIGSENVGMCVDMGNSVSLLEDPMEVIEAYAPYAFSVHLKDVAVREHEDGFAMAQVPLGEGVVDLPRAVEVIRGHRPNVRFSLEVMTRDPLRIPCLTGGYIASMCEVSAAELARTLRMVKAKGRKEPLPQISELEREEQFRLEDENIRKCLTYASETLGL